MAQSNRARAGTFVLFPLYLTLSSVNTLGLSSSCLEGVLLADARLGHGLTVAGASRRRASTPGSRSTASGSSAGTRTSHQRARARRRRRTLLRPAARLRTRSRGIAPPSPLPRRVLSVVYPTPASSSVPAGAAKTLPIARAYVQWRCLLTNNLRDCKMSLPDELQSLVSDGMAP